MARIGIIAGEMSGDLLGSNLIPALRKLIPNATFEGIAGPKMIAQGCQALFPAERLAVMGLIEVLGRYRELKKIQTQIIAHFITNPPDVFIGIDAPDFNLTVEEALKNAGITTVHYVSPSVWAWRQYRIKKIKRAVDVMLTLFPFEADFYKKHGMEVEFVGHPLADLIPLHTDQQEARQTLGLPLHATILALLPGSRQSEVQRLANPFLKAALWCLQQQHDLHVVVPLATPELHKLFEEQLQRIAAPLPITLIDGKSLAVMAAADAVLMASGTATLEALLLKRPLVVAYKLSPLTYYWAKSLLKIDNYSLPNLLAGRRIVPELIQDQATPENLGNEVLKLLKGEGPPLNEIFHDIHLNLKKDASRRAAEIIVRLINS